MPNYSYKCPNCGEVGSMFREIDKRDDLPFCIYCDVKMARVLEAPAVHMLYSPMHPRHMRGQRGQRNK